MPTKSRSLAKIYKLFVFCLREDGFTLAASGNIRSVANLRRNKIPGRTAVNLSKRIRYKFLRIWAISLINVMLDIGIYMTTGIIKRPTSMMLFYPFNKCATLGKIVLIGTLRVNTVRRYSLLLGNILLLTDAQLLNKNLLNLADKTFIFWHCQNTPKRY